MPSACLLALDAATETLHLAVWRDGVVQARALAGGAQASMNLLPAIASLVDAAGARMADIDAIGYGRGPGAFTGLRTACAIAQGLAIGLDRPLVALDTLALVAESAHRQAGFERVWTLLDARMGEAYAACWQRIEGADGVVDWQLARDASDAVIAAPMLLRPDALRALVQAHPAALAGPGWTVHEAAASGLDLPVCPQALPDGEALAALAWRAHAARRWIDPALALPLYVRDKVAQTTAERAAERVDQPSAVSR
ncbi:tRNA (adenosine(37)-N6)-threonylcarbamoyltransferase complex dimerization subunit type 1 TsaB [Leptothrix discophora]|uniref:tRNA (Adenosine(37)-N6)-threonylcarbamoyltransferase complex dimerization subunit type 1 TsaB n=1 Tax=Leptothrix discophora TaxID=89 RepID=A0ABT9G7A2_LEPDI|nr:tRNA (adenosine(37)-N6)-threonylcarbamoyltransferase complex dimerization subunit type 1 TsaB [Leptothrix discophora]MDP4302310.1 tRNA (adenosine(37)-N6)-threonylcarbamoyltransferase complex dimerization subunit type 1 TsaB [Leptothrix discophora]